MDRRICTWGLPKIQEELEWSCQQLPPTVTQGLNKELIPLNQQMATAGFAGTLALSTSSVNEESCWLFEDHEGRKHKPNSLVELYIRYHYGYIVDSVMIHHVDNKFRPFGLKSLISSWITASPGALILSSFNGHETAFLQDFVSGISQEVCSWLHMVIMNAACRTLLDEIVNHALSECISEKKDLKKASSQSVKMSSHGTRMGRSEWN